MNEDPVPNREGYELTAMQQGMLFNALYAPSSGIDLEQIICHLPEVIEIDALQKAWRNALRRHAILRSSFSWEGLESPKRQVHEDMSVQITQIDLSAMSFEEQEAVFTTYCRTDRRSGFVFDVPPLMRLSLFKCSRESYKLLWTFPHALLDGRSFAILIREVFDDYSSIKAGGPASPAEVPQFEAYIQWLARQDHTLAEAFWRRTLAGFRAPTPLLSDGLAPEPVVAGRTEDAWHHGIDATVPDDVAEKLRALADPTTATTHTFLQGAWALLLSRCSGESDVVFGSTRAGRHAPVPGISDMAGILINTLPLRVRCDETKSLREFLSGIRAEQIALREVETTPLMKIQGWSELSRGTRLFDSILVYDDRSLQTILQGLGGAWSHRRFEIVEKTSFPVTVLAWGQPHLTIRIQHDPQRLSVAQGKMLLDQLLNLLSGMARGLDQPLSALEHLSEESRRLAWEVWNPRPTAASDATCLHHLVERNIPSRAQQTALVCGSQRISYGELERRARIIASALQTHGAQGNEPVAVILERSTDLPIALYGVLKTGACYVPLDPSNPRDRIFSVLQQTKARFVITTSEIRTRLSFDAEITVILLDQEWYLTLTHREFQPREVPAGDLAYIIFTSGSTGRPKGVMIEHRGAVNTILDLTARFSLAQSDSVLAVSSYTFDLSVFDIFGLLAVGGTVVLLEPAAVRDPYRWAELIAQEHITVWNSVPALMEMLVEATVAKRDSLQSLRTIMLSGDWIPISLPERIHETVPLAQQFSLGGATEASIWSILHPITLIDARWSSIPYGRPLLNQTMYVLDSRLEPCAVGVRGELYIGGIGLARGYWGDAAKTQAAFIIHPRTGERIYRTGDLGRWHEDGLIEFLGRIDGQIKIRGFRIELGEIETVASRHPGIKECVVAKREDIPGHPSLALYFIRNEGSQMEADDIRPHLQQQLPEYMIPAHYVEMTALPLSANGKVDKSQLPTPSHNQRRALRPPNELEQQLIAIWSDLLTAPNVGIEDNFFDLGGNSLLALRLIDRIENRCSLRTSLATIFQHATIERLAAQLKQENPPHASILIPLQVQGSRRPFFFISGFLDIGRHVGDDQPFYGLDCPAESKLHHPELSFQDLAQKCIQEMKRVQEHGPYLLGGHCFGAVVAFTIANLLQERGEQVRLLALMDPPLPGSITQQSGRINRLRYHFMNLIRRNPVAGYRYLRDRMHNFRNRISERLRGEKYEAMYSDFKPALFRGQLALFLAEDTFLRYDPTRDPRLQWGIWASGGLDIIESSGDHVTFCREPHVQGLGRKLRDYLDKVQCLPPQSELADFTSPRVSKSTAEVTRCTVGEAV